MVPSRYKFRIFTVIAVFVLVEVMDPLIGKEGSGREDTGEF